MGFAGKAGSFTQGFMDAFNAERDRQTRKKESEQNILINKQLMEMRQQQADFQKWQQERAMQEQSQEEQTVRGLMTAYADKVPGFEPYGPKAPPTGDHEAFRLAPYETGGERGPVPDLKTTMALLQDYRQSEETKATMALRDVQAQATKAQADAATARADVDRGELALREKEATEAKAQNEASTRAILQTTATLFPGLHNEIATKIPDIDKIGPAAATLIANTLATEVNNNRLNVQQKFTMLQGLQDMLKQVGIKEASIYADPTLANTKASRGMVEGNMAIIKDGIQRSMEELQKQITADITMWQQRTQGQPQGNMTTAYPPGAAQSFIPLDETGNMSGPSGPQSPF